MRCNNTINNESLELKTQPHKCNNHPSQNDIASTVIHKYNHQIFLDKITHITGYDVSMQNYDIYKNININPSSPYFKTYDRIGL